GVIANTASVTSATTDPTPANNADTETTAVGAVADVGVTLAGSPDPVLANGLVTYTITVTTAGPSDAQGVTLTDAIPAGMTFVSFTAPAGWVPTTPADGASGTVTATLATLPAGSGPQVFTLVLRANQGTPPDTILSNTVTVAATTNDPNSPNDAATVTTRVGEAVLPVVVVGGARVVVFDPVSGAQKFSFFAYDPKFTGEVRTASGDVNGDGVADIITAAGPGGAAHIKVFDGRTGDVLFSFFAYDSSFRNGAYVAAGDVNGDGYADIITGAGPGAGPHGKVFSGKDGSLLQSFFAYDASFTGGVTVAAGDVNGDGKADIVTGAASGGSGHVKVFDGQSRQLLRSFFAFD